MTHEENKNDQVQKKIEIKYKDPGRFDIAPYGQIWKVIGEKDQIDIWAQVSQVKDEPSWLNITCWFNKDFQALLRNKEFMELLRTL